MNAKSSNLAKNLFIVVIYLVLSVLWCSNFFALADLRSPALSDGDSALNAWALNWVSRTLVSDWSNLFNGNTFYPHLNSIALSEHLVGLALLNIPVHLVFDDAWIGYNLLIFEAYFFSALGGYLFIQHITKNSLAAFWGGIFWGFCFFRIHHIGHLQILSYQWFPFVALFIIKTRVDPNITNGLLLALFFTLQALTSWYLAVITSCLVFVIFLAYLTDTQWIARHTFIFGMSAIISAATILPLAIPYKAALTDTSLSDRMTTAEQLGDQVRLTDFLIPPDATVFGMLIPNNKYWIWQENTLYIGYVACLLALIGLLAGWCVNVRACIASVLLIMFGYVLAIGYFYSTWDAHLPLYYLSKNISFLAAIRATQRFALLIYFGILVLSSFGVCYLSRRLKRNPALLVCVFFSALFLIEVYPYKLPWEEIPTYSISKIDRAIKLKQTELHKKLILVHYPIYTALPGYPTRESKYMVDSTAHWAYVLNGFSGAEPVGFRQDMLTLNSLPSAEAFSLLKHYHVDAIALHKELNSKQKEAIKNFIDNSALGTIEEIDPDEYLILLKY